MEGGIRMIECYYKECPNHEIHFDNELGPFCSLNKCIASETELKEYGILRETFLKTLFPIKLI
jgi:hypothetical protein